MTAPRARRPALMRFLKTVGMGWGAIVMVAGFWHLALGAVPMIDLVALVLMAGWVVAAGVEGFVE